MDLVQQWKKTLRVIRKERKPGWELDVARCFSTLGSISSQANDYEAALEYHTKERKASEEIVRARSPPAGGGKNFQLESTKSLRFIGICHSELGHLEEARSFHKRHLDEASRHDFMVEIARGCLNLGNAILAIAKEAGSGEHHLRAEEYSQSGMEYLNEALRRGRALSLDHFFNDDTTTSERLIAMNRHNGSSQSKSSVQRLGSGLLPIPQEAQMGRARQILLRRCLYALAVAHSEFGSTIMEKRYLERIVAEKLCDENHPADASFHNKLLAALGHHFLTVRNWASAKDYLSKVVELTERRTSTVDRVFARYNLANYHIERRQWNRAKRFAHLDLNSEQLKATLTLLEGDPSQRYGRSRLGNLSSGAPKGLASAKRQSQEMLDMIQSSMDQISHGQELTEEAEEARRKLDDGDNPAETEAELWKGLSDACFDMKDYDKTIQAAYSLQQFVEANEDLLTRRIRSRGFTRDMRAHAISMQASSYRMLGKYSTALSLFHKEIELRREKPRDLSGEAAARVNRAYCYWESHLEKLGESGDLSHTRSHSGRLPASSWTEGQGSDPVDPHQAGKSPWDHDLVYLALSDYRAATQILVPLTSRIGRTGPSAEASQLDGDLSILEMARRGLICVLVKRGDILEAQEEQRLLNPSKYKEWWKEEQKRMAGGSAQGLRSKTQSRGNDPSPESSSTSSRVVPALDRVIEANDETSDNRDCSLSRTAKRKVRKDGSDSQLRRRKKPRRSVRRLGGDESSSDDSTLDLVSIDTHGSDSDLDDYGTPSPSLQKTTPSDPSCSKPSASLQHRHSDLEDPELADVSVEEISSSEAEAASEVPPPATAPPPHLLRAKNKPPASQRSETESVDIRLQFRRAQRSFIRQKTHEMRGPSSSSLSSASYSSSSNRATSEPRPQDMRQTSLFRPQTSESPRPKHQADDDEVAYQPPPGMTAPPAPAVNSAETEGGSDLDLGEIQLSPVIESAYTSCPDDSATQPDNVKTERPSIVPEGHPLEPSGRPQPSHAPASPEVPLASFASVSTDALRLQQLKTTRAAIPKPLSAESGAKRLRRVLPNGDHESEDSDDPDEPRACGRALCKELAYQVGQLQAHLSIITRERDRLRESNQKLQEKQKRWETWRKSLPSMDD